MNEFDVKYADSDLKYIEVDEIQSAAECAYLMARLDEVIGDIETQIDQAKANVETRGVYADQTWFIAAKRALRGAKAKRSEVQSWRGQISKQEKLKRQIRIERAFMDAAMRVLPTDAVKSIWDNAYAHEPELRQ